MTGFLLLALGLSACGGGGGGAAQVLFGLAGTVPSDGDVRASGDSPIAISFTQPTDLDTITTQTVRLTRGDGTPVAGEILKQDFNRANVQFRPFAFLEQNRLYRLTLDASIRSAAGAPLGRDRHSCFITASPFPTVRPDQVIDLGDALNVPRYLARAIRLDGRWFVIGGYRSPTEVTDTIEIWDPDTRTFVFSPVRMTTPRAEHTVTLMDDGRVLIAGGVAVPGADPLKSTEIFDPTNNGLAPGPEMNDARRSHAASALRSGEAVMVSGGFGDGGAALDTIEVFDGGPWELLRDTLPEPTHEHLQITSAFDQVYFGPSNLRGLGARFDGSEVTERQEPDIRFRATALPVESDLYMIVGGDTRSVVFYDFQFDVAVFGSDVLHERRGAHTLTRRGIDGDLYLVAGGFNIAAVGSPALSTLEVLQYFGRSRTEILFYRVEIELPVPFAGHVGFNQSDGATVLAGGVGDGTGDHSRRVVMVLDAGSTPSVACDE